MLKHLDLCVSGIELRMLTLELVKIIKIEEVKNELKAFNIGIKLITSRKVVHATAIQNLKEMLILFFSDSHNHLIILVFTSAPYLQDDLIILNYL